MATYFAPIGSGLGDVIVSLPFIFGLIEQGETYLVARSPRQEGLTQAIGGLAGTVRETAVNSILSSSDRLINTRTHWLQTDYVWGGEKFEHDYPDHKIEDIVVIMSKDSGIDATRHLSKRLNYTPVPEMSDTVVLVPGTTTMSKTWSSKNWLELAALMTGVGAPFVVLGEPERSSVVKELIESGVNWRETPLIQDAIDIISSARAVVSVDTGLMHIGVTQGVSTVAMYQGYPLYYRARPNCFPLFSKMCPKECLNDLESAAPNEKLEYTDFAWFDGTFGTCLAAPGTSCMDSISPDNMFARLQEALSGGVGPTRTPKSSIA